MQTNQTQNTSKLSIENMIKPVALGLVAILVIVGIVSFFSNRSSVSEKEAQSKIADIEKQYSSYKEKLSLDQRIEQLKKDPKAKDVPKPSTFDIEAYKKQLNDFLATDTKSSAARMVALYYSEILSSEKKATEALDVVKKVIGNETQDLTGFLVQKRYADLLSDNGQCDQALPVWEKLAKNEKASFMAADNKILQALCYQEKNDFKKAEELLTAVSNDKSENNIESAQKAQRLLRSLKFKTKISGS